MRMFEGYVIQWDLWVQLAGHLAWPIVTLFVLLAFKKPVRELLTRADSFEVGGVKVSSQLKTLTAEVNEGLKEAELRLTQTPEDIEDAIEERPVSLDPLTGDEKRIEEGWRLVSDALDIAFDEITQVKGADAVPKLARTYFRQRRYLLCSNQMVLGGWISFELRDTVKALLDVRESVADQNARISEADANVFARNCEKTARSILNAVRYRLRPGAAPLSPPSAPAN
jgi:hypothetical protein